MRSIGTGGDIGSANFSSPPLIVNADHSTFGRMRHCHMSKVLRLDNGSLLVWQLLYVEQTSTENLATWDSRSQVKLNLSVMMPQNPSNRLGYRLTQRWTNWARSSHRNNQLVRFISSQRIPNIPSASRRETSPFRGTIFPRLLVFLASGRYPPNH